MDSIWVVPKSELETVISEFAVNLQRAAVEVDTWLQKVVDEQKEVPAVGRTRDFRICNPTLYH